MTTNNMIHMMCNYISNCIAGPYWYPWIPWSCWTTRPTSKSVTVSSTVATLYSNATIVYCKYKASGITIQHTDTCCFLSLTIYPVTLTQRY